MKKSLLIAVLVLAGCAQFENRVLCSPNRQEAAFMSWYMNYGVGAIISPKDAQYLCSATAPVPPAAASAAK